jgi:predicted DNA-binding transcriptional regulator AlpA
MAQEIDIQELAEAIAAALARHIAPDDPAQLYDHGDLARLFKVSRSTIFRRAKEENWPRTRLGTDEKSTRFSRADIAAIQAMSTQAPPPAKTVPSVGTRANRRRK